jgi:hypothetical protein
MKNIFLLTLLPFFYLPAQAQRLGSIAGVVSDKYLLTPLSGATVTLTDSPYGSLTDSLGQFRIKGIAPKTYTLKVSALGYADYFLYNVVITSGNEIALSIQLEQKTKELEEVFVKNKKTALAASLETPLSVQKLTTEEIRSNPGGNFDIARVVQVLPGVGGTSGSVGGYRNDIIIRGGAPNENVYYLDGIEIPVINHFSTQGSGGGPTGILNVSFIEEVKLSTSSFDARYDNALSSVFQFRQRNGNPNQLQGNVRLSATELATTLEGPLSSKTTFLASARRSYLQLLFKAIDLPIRPNYWDFQYKVTHRINKKLTLTLLGIGAIDHFSFGIPREATPEKLYVLDATPAINQWNYTVGATLRKQIPNGFWTLAASRSMLDNNVEKFDGNAIGDESKRRTGIFSQEIENKLRLEVNHTKNNFKLSYGGVAQYVKSNNNAYQRIRQEFRDVNGNILQPALAIRYTSNIKFWRAGAFLQVSKRALANKLNISAGLRTDINSFTDQGTNPIKTLSGRFNFSYLLNQQWTLNASVGNYFKLAPYTILSYKDNAGKLVNKDAAYTQSTHYVIGVEYLPSPTTRFTVESFYKHYQQVPISIRDGISLANLGGDFTVLGNEDVSTNGSGNAMGLELFFQQKLTKRFFTTASYTFFKSQFSGISGENIASAWDNRHLFSFLGGYKLKKNWEIGLKFRLQGGAPYTPFNLAASQLNYLSIGTGLLDYAKINSLRLKTFHASDLRIDKKWNFKQTTLNLFLDITNWYAAKSPAFPQFTFKRNDSNTAFVTTNGLPIQLNGSNAIPVILNNQDGTLIPTIGFIVEF